MEYIPESSVAETRPSNESLSADEVQTHNLLAEESTELRNFIDNDPFSTISFESTEKHSWKDNTGELLQKTGSNEHSGLSASDEDDIFEPIPHLEQQREEKGRDITLTSEVDTPAQCDTTELNVTDTPSALEDKAPAHEPTCDDAKEDTSTIQREPIEDQSSMKLNMQEDKLPDGDPQFTNPNELIQPILKRIEYLESENKKSKKERSALRQRIIALERGIKKRTASLPSMLSQEGTVVTPMKAEEKPKIHPSSPASMKRTREITPRKIEKTPHRGREKKAAQELTEPVDKTMWKSVDKTKSPSISDDCKVVLLYHGKCSTEEVKSLNTKVESLKGEVNDAPGAPHTHLISITEECGRYLKTLIALIQGIPIVTKDWIRQSFKRGGWLDIRQFLCADAPNQLIPRRGLLPEFRNAMVGILGDTRPGVADFKQIIEALGGELREITNATRRHMEDVKIIIVPANTPTESFADEIQKMPELRSIFTDENLKEVIWEGDRSRLRNLHENSGKEGLRTPKLLHCRVPYLEEIPDRMHRSADPRRIYPISAAECRALTDEQRPPFLVGRSLKCQYTLPYEGISRVHFALEVLQGVDRPTLLVEDKESTNGVFVNQIKRRGRTMLHEGDTLLIGGGAGVADGASMDDSMDIDYSAKFVVRYSQL
ncbi:FHA domain-containing protein [Perkinsela sp. CCAP 1560/4]|nr:FHA domain-containing protein [Perkinsela sp. CCAP 1560/4]|eukprot:KNH04811.1 FHA domain-containing protein [Perkinsela sp. CCAP 1560/4]